MLSPAFGCTSVGADGKVLSVKSRGSAAFFIPITEQAGAPLEWRECFVCTKKELSH